MDRIKWVCTLMLLTLTACLSGCGDDEKDEPDAGNSGGGSSSNNVLTIDGQKWSKVVINEFICNSSDYYFTYTAYDSENGTRTFEFMVETEEVDKMGDIAQDITINNLGDLTNINLRDMRTEYISGKVNIRSMGMDGIALDFQNYECYYYPDSEGTSNKYKHTINGWVRFSGIPNNWK